MNLQSLPEEMVEGHLLPFLEWNDLLRFRKVCKTFHGIVKGYMKVHPELAPEIEINESGKSFARFIKLDIPTTKLFLNNTSDLGHGLYEKQWNDAKRFLRKYGTQVKSLRVDQMSLYVCGKELEFLEAMVNLEKFEAGHYALGNNMQEAVIENLKRANRHPPMSDLTYPIPESFAGLKILKIGRCGETLALGHVIFIYNPLAGSTLLEARNLEYVAPPMGSELLLPPPNLGITLLCHFVSTLRSKLKLDQPEGKLKVIDFLYHHDVLPGDDGRMIERYASGSSFYNLLGLCAQANIMVKHVSGSWFQQNPNPVYDANFNESGTVVLSMINLHPNVFLLDMDNLERLEIRQSSRSYVGTDWRRQPGRRSDWPALKSLDLHVDSTRPQVPYHLAGPFGNQNEPGLADLLASTKVLFQFLFQGISRLALTELQISFEKDDGSLPMPKMEDVVASCPNLKKLTLVKWPGTNKSLVTLWNGLPALEEVSLEYCKNLGNVAFVGEDQQNPVFFKLKNLKKLSLKGLDQMPKVTDTLFSLVIRHLSLTHFIVTSDAPVKSVTLVGVQSLLGSWFAESIYKFPFCNWSLDKTTSEEWKKLEMKFRSYEML